MTASISTNARRSAVGSNDSEVLRRPLEPAAETVQVKYRFTSPVTRLTRSWLQLANTTILANIVNTEFKRLSPSKAWEEAQKRSLAIGIAGCVVVAALQAAGAVPSLYRASLAPASGLAAVFLTALALFLAHYHNRWRLGICIAAVTFSIPYTVNFLWIRFSGRSLLYPMATLVLVGVISLWTMHRRFAGPGLEDDVEEAIIRKMMEDPALNFTWIERVTWFCIIVGLVLLLILLLR